MIVILAWILQLMALLILVRALLSWFNPDPRNPVVMLIYQVTEPILEPLRRIIPRIGMIDITPMVAMLILYFIASALLRGI